MSERFQIHLSVDVSITEEDLEQVINDIEGHMKTINIKESSTEPIVQKEFFYADKSDENDWEWDTYVNLNPDNIIKEGEEELCELCDPHL